MTSSDVRISSSSVYLFASQFRYDFPPKMASQVVKDDWLISKYKEILDNFYVYQPIEVQANAIQNDRLLSSSSSLSKGSKCQSFSGTIQTDRGMELITGIASPIITNDSYVIALGLHDRLRFAEPIELNRVKYFHPHKCFLPENIASNIGQTILINILLTNSKKTTPNWDFLKSLADKCLVSFLQSDNLEQCPKFYRSGELLGGYIFEYGRPESAHELGHLMIHFFYDRRALENFSKHYFDLQELFLYYQKIIYAYRAIEQKYDLGCLYLRVFEKKVASEHKNRDCSNLETPNRLNRSHTSLNYLKQELNFYKRKYFDYEQLLLGLNEDISFLKINTNNYWQKLKELNQKYRKDLKFLYSFALKECINFQEQSQSYLRYLERGSELFSKSIDITKGLVEIKQAENIRSLQNTITVVAVGMGLGLGGIITVNSVETNLNPIKIEFPSKSLNSRNF